MKKEYISAEDFINGSGLIFDRQMNVTLTFKELKLLLLEYAELRVQRLIEEEKFVRSSYRDDPNSHANRHI